MPLTNRSRILFLIFVVLGVYYPTLFGGANSVDDHKMFAVLAEQPQTDWKALFIPTSGTYYRPLLWSTFVADHALWDLTESFMHLENILLHAMNTVLVFLLASKVLTRNSENRLELPLVSALLFALHPINTESVAWISGRTDPLAALFVLSAALFLMKGLQEDRYRYFVLATGFLLLGCLSKEVAVFFLPAACFIVLCHDGAGVSGAWFSRAKLKRLAVLVAPFGLCGLAYVYLRFSASSQAASGILQLLWGRNGSALNTLRLTFKAFGFYVKKLFLPLPLNFAIFEVHEFYVWVGACAIVLLVLVARRNSILAAFTVTVGILIVPAILVVLSHVAWTPVAERYLYLPSAFFAITLVGSVQLAGEGGRIAHGLRLFLIMLLVPAAYFTMQRNITWQSNLALYQDTFNKSPSSAIVKNELAIALARSGQFTEAERHLEEAKKQDPQRRYVLPYLNQAELKISTGDLDGARALILQVLKGQAEDAIDPSALRMLAKIEEKRLFKTDTSSAVRAIHREIADLHERLYNKTHNPIDLYRGGQMELLLGEKEKARILFEKAYQSAPDGTYFKPAAKKLAEKLKP